MKSRRDQANRLLTLPISHDHNGYQNTIRLQMQMYDLEQSLARLQSCECRKSCKWRRPKGPAGDLRANNSAKTTTTTATQPTTDKYNARLATRATTATTGAGVEDDDAEEDQDGQDGVQMKEDGQVWRDEQDKCNVCSCHVSVAARRALPARLHSVPEGAWSSLEHAPTRASQTTVSLPAKTCNVPGEPKQQDAQAMMTILELEARAGMCVCDLELDDEHNKQLGPIDWPQVVRAGRQRRGAACCSPEAPSALWGRPPLGSRRSAPLIERYSRGFAHSLPGCSLSEALEAVVSFT